MSKRSGLTGVQLDDLRNASRDLARMAKQLEAQIKELDARIESLGAAGAGTGSAKTVPTSRARSDAHTNASLFVVRVEPLRELAMAAMAETALRDTPSVVKVVSVERAEDWATFTLEVRDGADLVEEMESALPVHFKVTDSSPGRLSIAFDWAWGDASPEE